MSRIRDRKNQRGIKIQVAKEYRSPPVNRWAKHVEAVVNTKKFYDEIQQRMLNIILYGKEKHGP